MSDQEKSVTARKSASDGDETLPDLIGRLGEDLATIMDAKLNLLKIEIKEDVAAYSQYGMMMAVGAIIATVGFALLNVAIAFFISTLFDGTSLSQPVKYALGFIVTALLYLVIGGVVILRAKNSMAGQTPLPDRSIKEIKKDTQWIKEEL